jgi:hypothetical protein
VAVLIGVGTGLRAQDAPAQGQAPAEPAGQPPPQQQPAPQDPLKFNRMEPVLIIYQIKPERAMDFETGWRTIKDLLTKATNPALQQFAQTFEVLKLEGVPAGAPNIYIFDIPNPSQTYSYNPVAMLYSTLQEAEKVITREEADEIWKKLENSWDQINPWPVQKLGF